MEKHEPVLCKSLKGIAVGEQSPFTPVHVPHYWSFQSSNSPSLFLQTIQHYLPIVQGVGGGHTTSIPLLYLSCHFTPTHPFQIIKQSQGPVFHYLHHFTIIMPSETYERMRYENA